MPGREGARVLGPRRYGLVMNTAWWLALAAVVLLALVTALVDGWGRGHRPRRDRRRGKEGETE
ncbi:hypothetical protein SUDANB60_02410 [Streptomyces sp. enrichment culture]|nr:hypothetical protein GCM10018789_09040 [Streptomyces werraensis]